MPRRHQRSSSPPPFTVIKPSSEPSFKPSSTPASKPLASASARASRRRSPNSKPAEKRRRPLHARTAAAERRRKSGLTIEQRLAALSDRLLAMVKHFPLDGIHLVEVCEELADSAEYKVHHRNG